MRCTVCEAEVGGEDLNLDKGVGWCRACRSVIDLTPERRAGSPAVRRPRVPMPSAFTVTEPLGGPPLAGYRDAPAAPGELVIRRRWRSLAAYGMIFFCLFWDGFLVFWYGMTGVVGAPLMFKLFPLLHVGVGVWLTYTTVAQLFNKTTITVSSAVLSIRHAPLPWPGNKVVPVDQIEQLYCEEDVSQSRGRASRTYAVSALLKDGRKLRLLGGLPENGDALFVEQRVEEHLGIAGAEVPGEIGA